MKRLVVRSLFILPLLIVVAALCWGWKDAISVLVGGLITAVNILWTVRGADAILEGARGRPDQRQVFWYMLRLLLIFGTLFAMIHFSFLGLWGAVLGLSVPILSTFLEALILIFDQTKRSR